MQVEMSNQKCNCGKQLKQHMVDKKRIVVLCYSCWCKKESKRNHNIGVYGRPRQNRIDNGLPVKVYKS